MENNTNIYDRITAIIMELEVNISNPVRVLNGVRNILYEIDGLTMDSIRDYLLNYYAIYPRENITTALINQITENAPSNTTVGNVLNGWFNSYNNSVVNQYSINPNQNTALNIPPQNSIPLSTNYQTPQNSLSIEFSLLNPPHYSTNSNQSILQMSNQMNQPISGLNTEMYDLSGNLFNLFNLFNVPIQTNQEDVPLVLKKESLDKLVVQKYSDLDDKIKKHNLKCMIKLEEFKDDDIVRLLPCNHCFTKNLIDDWLSNSSYKCPLCRKEAGEYDPKL